MAITHDYPKTPDGDYDRSPGAWTPFLRDKIRKIIDERPLQAVGEMRAGGIIATRPGKDGGGEPVLWIELGGYELIHSCSNPSVITVCGEHATMVVTASIKAARNAARERDEWCPGCAGDNQ